MYQYAAQLALIAGIALSLTLLAVSVFQYVKRRRRPFLENAAIGLLTASACVFLLVSRSDCLVCNITPLRTVAAYVLLDIIPVCCLIESIISARKPDCKEN